MVNIAGVILRIVYHEMWLEMFLLGLCLIQIIPGDPTNPVNNPLHICLTRAEFLVIHSLIIRICVLCKNHATALVSFAR